MVNTGTQVSPINSICLSRCRQFVECWNDGNLVQSFILGDQHASEVVELAQTWFEQWTGYRANVSKELRDGEIKQLS